MRRIVSCVRTLSLALSALTLTDRGFSAMQELPPAPAPADAAVTVPIPGPPVPLPGSTSEAVTSGQTTGEEEVLLRGPVHEAFAEQFNQDPVEGVVIPRKPPELIEEIPPELRPDGRQIEWISGYWSWDDEENDFLWISGIWREVPQGFRWLPGYWTETVNGYQWVSGTWISAQTEEIQYLESAPPASLELGPVGTAPSVNHFWISGCWNWNETRYAWRPGYWSIGHTDWIWVPERYVCTPRGFIYGTGYWDYPLSRRGLLFAPCRFRHRSHWDHGYRFTPRVIVAANLLPLHFWVRPSFRHYYFGDFYGDNYAGRGFQPWHQFHRQRRQFDPLFAHFSRTRSGDRTSYYDQVNHQFDLLQGHPDRRPFRGFGDNDRRPASDRADNDLRPTLLGTTLQQHMKETGSARFVKVENDVRQRLQHDTRELRTLVEQRREVERPAHGSGDKLRERQRDQAQTEPENTSRGAAKTDGAELPRLDGEKNRPGRADGGKDSDSQPVARRDGLKLPSRTRPDNDSEKSRSKADANSDTTSKHKAPGTPVTRGERPRGVDESLNRARQSANAGKGSRQNESVAVPERGDHSTGRPLGQKSSDAAKRKSDGPKDRVLATPRDSAAIRKETTRRVQQGVTENSVPKDSTVGRRIHAEAKGQADNAIRSRVRAETELPGAAAARESRVRAGQTRIPSHESGNNGQLRSGRMGERPDVGSPRANPPQRSAREFHSAPPERSSRGAVERRSEPRNEVRVDTPRSNGPAERSRQADAPRSAPVPRERGNRDSSGSGRGKK